jgi:NADH-quinone oxidoreductase subunit K
MTLNDYLIVSTIIFAIGMIGVIRRKNLIMLLEVR